jgi:hypothetical protein
MISTFIHMNIVRLEGHPFTLPDDPFDLEQYSDIIHPGRWQVQMKGVPLLQDSSLWGPIGSRMNTVDSVIADALEDAQLSIIYRRIFSGEGETVDGLLDNDVANGQLVLEIGRTRGWPRWLPHRRTACTTRIGIICRCRTPTPRRPRCGR